MARIIIADDDEIVGEIAQDALAAAGHEVHLVNDGIEALHAIKVEKPNLVILDYNMCGLSGILVLRAMRETIELRETPVLMLTGHQGEADEESARIEGASGYMRKPFDPNELVLRVRGIGFE